MPCGMAKNSLKNKQTNKNLLVFFDLGFFSSWVPHIVRRARKHRAAILVAGQSQVEKRLHILIWITIKYILHIKYIKEPLRAGLALSKMPKDQK